MCRSDSRVKNDSRAELTKIVAPNRSGVDHVRRCIHKRVQMNSPTLLKERVITVENVIEEKALHRKSIHSR